MRGIRRFTVVSLMLGLTASGSAARAEAEEVTSRVSTLSESGALGAAQQWATLVGDANVVALEKLLNDKYLHIHATALVESKAQFLDALRSGARKYDPIRIEDAEVRVFGGSAVVTGRFNLKAFSRGRTIEGVNRFALVLVTTNDGPQVASFQATPIPAPPK